MWITAFLTVYYSVAVMLTSRGYVYTAQYRDTQANSKWASLGTEKGLTALA